MTRKPLRNTRTGRVGFVFKERNVYLFCEQRDVGQSRMLRLIPKIKPCLRKVK